MIHTSSVWLESRLHLGMPHLTAGRLAEEPIIKHMGALAWEAAAALAGVPENAVQGETGERLHMSMISFELGMPEGRAWEEFDEGADLRFYGRAGVFGHKLVEGLFLFDDEPILDDELQQARGRDDLAGGRRPWAYLTHGFVAATPSPWVKLETPRAFLTRPLPELSAMPAGIVEHQAVERSGKVGGLAKWEQAAPLAGRVPHVQVLYQVHPETDFNAAGLLYCARFPAIMGVGERRLLRDVALLSEPLVACLRTEHRRIYYFANSSSEDQLQIRTHARFSPPAPTAPTRVRTMGHVLLRTDLHRASDGVLMASSLVQKALRIPGQMKPLLTESERLIASLRGAVD